MNYLNIEVRHRKDILFATEAEKISHKKMQQTLVYKRQKKPFLQVLQKSLIIYNPVSKPGQP